MIHDEPIPDRRRPAPKPQACRSLRPTKRPVHYDSWLHVRCGRRLKLAFASVADLQSKDKTLSELIRELMLQAVADFWHARAAGK